MVTRWLVLAVICAVMVLAGCVRGDDMSETYLVYLPAVAHDCTPIICGEVERLNALLACEQEMARLRISEARVRMPDDCWGDNLLPFMEDEP